MKSQNMIIDKQQYQKTASQFLSILFAESLKKNYGEIEIKGFENGPNTHPITIMFQLRLIQRTIFAKKVWMFIWECIQELARRAPRKISIGS